VTHSVAAPGDTNPSDATACRFMLYYALLYNTGGGSFTGTADCRRMEISAIRAPPASPLARDNCINGLMQRLVLPLPWKRCVRDVFEKKMNENMRKRVARSVFG